MYRWLNKYLELKREYDYLDLGVEEDELRKKELEQHIDKIKNFVDKFDDVDSIILVQKYLYGKSLIEIAAHSGYSHGHIRQKHAELVKMIKFSDQLKNEREEVDA